jgi:hypothetical protein
LHLSAIEAGSHIATAYDLAGPQPELPETAAASRHGLSGVSGSLAMARSRAARRGLVGPQDAIPVNSKSKRARAVDGDPDPFAAAADLRTTAQRNHDAINAGCEISHS